MAVVNLACKKNESKEKKCLQRVLPHKTLAQVVHCGEYNFIGARLSKKPRHKLGLEQAYLACLSFEIKVASIRPE
jgi:hypothetical protein